MNHLSYPLSRFNLSSWRSSMFAILEPTLLLISTLSIIHKSYLFKDELHNSVATDNNTSQLESFILGSMLCTSFLPLLSTVILRFKASPDNDHDNTTCNEPIMETNKSNNVITVTKSRGIYKIRYLKRDEIGMSIGSLLPSLTLLSFTVPNIKTSRNEECVSTNANNHFLLVYLTLFSCVGLSFSLVSFGLILHSRLSTKKVNTKQMISTSYIVLVYIMLLSICTSFMSGNDSSQIIQIVVFSTFFIVMLVLYEDNSYYRVHHGRHPITVLQRVFTIGEWVALTCFLSLLVSDYFLRYIIMPMIHNALLLKMPTYLIVSHSGIIGCLIGCIIPISSVSMKIQHVVVIQMQNRKLGAQDNITEEKRQQCISTSQNECIKVIITCSLRVLLVVACVLFSINLALYQECIKSKDLMYGTNSNDYWCRLIRGNVMANENYDHDLRRLVRLIISSIPTAVLWLVYFLSSPETTKETNHQHSMASMISTFPRYIWLIYWIIVLLCTIPIAIIIAKSLSKYQNLTKKKKVVVVGRKFFHFVAVALFTPPTLYAPSMMFLSYSIASAMLIFIESLRLNFSQASSSQCDDNVKHPPKSAHGMVETNSFTMNDFFQTFFDEKDLGAMDGGFVVTHIALVAGCAIPLWFHHIYTASIPTDSNSSLTLNLMPYMGILSLGIGDAAGALYGTFCGKTFWPESRRTIEGSIAMFISMIVSLNCLNPGFWSAFVLTGSLFRDFILLFPIVMLEAVTTQIDNFFLPLFAVNMCMLLS